MGRPTNDDAAQSYFLFVQDVHTGRITRVAFPSAVQVGLIDIPADLTVTGATQAMKGLTVGTSQEAADLISLGRLALNVVDFTATATVGTRVLTVSETVICVINVAAVSPIKITLPLSPINGEIHIVKDVSGTAAVTNIRVQTPSTASTVDGAAFKTINVNFGVLAVIWRTNAWRVLFKI